LLQLKHENKVGTTWGKLKHESRALPGKIKVIHLLNLFPYSHLNRMPPWVAKNGANTRDSTAMSLMRMFSEGPEVSFRGSPMVSPMTAALCGSEPFGPKALACSDTPA
jgi:hypothetical protein